MNEPTTPRPWPENAWPTAAELADWLSRCTSAERLEYADRALTTAQNADRAHRDADAQARGAVDRERAAWATKIETLEPTWHRGMYGCPDDMFTRRDLRALLADDDTEAKP